MLDALELLCYINISLLEGGFGECRRSHEAEGKLRPLQEGGSGQVPVRVGRRQVPCQEARRAHR
jgi:hypothetical protein